MIRHAIVSALLTATLAQPAAADDILVEPSPIEPQVKIKGKRVVWNAPSISEEVPTTSQPTSQYTPPQVCRVDAEVGTYGCRTYQPDDEEDADDRELTEGDIVRAVRQIGLPRLDVSIEPGNSTLVNAATNFYTDPEAFARNITLIGFDVDLRASPARYTWVHGDGTRASTTQPGQPYPDLNVTHRYTEPADVVRPRVDVTYRVRYRVDGGPWTTLGETLTASGPTTDLEVNEAAPVLTAP